MNRDSANTPIVSPRWSWRHVPWVGGLFIAVIVGMAAYDVYRSHQTVVAETDRELESHARVIAEQTARSLQTVDRVLGHVVDEYRSGVVANKSPAELYAYLRDQAVGLVQIEGLSLVDAQGNVHATSAVPSLPQPLPNIAALPLFQRLAANRQAGTVVDKATPAIVRQGPWVFRIVRRLDNAAGEFAGIVAAGGKVEYFQQFYRDVRLDVGTNITLIHHDGSLVARHPAVESALGQRFPAFDALIASRNAGLVTPTRATSPIDGVDRFAAIEQVPDYPLTVIVTRNAAVALAPWRQQAVGTAARTLALSVLGLFLLSMVRRQFLRLDKARASLEVSRERFALAAAGSDDGIWDWDVEGDRIFASARAREIFGLPPGPDAQPRDIWFAEIQIHPDDAASRREAIEAHLMGRAPAYAGEYRVRDPNGAYRWIRVRGVCVRDATGQPTRMAGSVSDIDSRRRAEDALRLSEERYALAMTGSTGGHWVWEVATDALFVSGTVNQLFGLPADTQPGTRESYFARVTVHPEDLVTIQQINDEVLGGHASRLDFEYRIVLPDGGDVRWILSRAECFRDAEGKAVRVAGVSVDISERKRTEQALRLSEERFALAVAGSNDGIIDWDVVGDRMYTSERAMEMLGVDSKVTVRTRAEWLDLFKLHPDDRQRHTDELCRFLDSDETLRAGEYRVRRADGEYRWVRLRNLCIRDAAGRPLRLAGSVSDIDAYKRVESALRESEERYALAMTGSNEGHWVWNMVDDQVYVSPKLRELFCIAQETEFDSYASYFAQIPIHPDDRARVVERRNDHLEGRTPQIDHEFRIVMPGTGEIRWMHTRGQCFRDASGKPMRVAGSTVDATQRKQAEESLRRSEERYALSVAGSDDGVWDFDFTTGMVFNSRRGRQITGMPLDPELQPMDEWFGALKLHPDDAPRRLRAMEAHLSGATPAYVGEWRILQTDGSYRWVRVHGMCTRDAQGKPLRMAGSVTDIDARKRAEESLRQSEARYALAVAGSDDGVWDWDFAAGLAFESARARELQGLPPGPELQPLNTLIDSLRVHPDDEPRRAEGIRAHLAGETAAYECEYRVRHEDGVFRWIRVRALCVRDAEGKPCRMAGSVSDIDARRRAEEALRKSEERFSLAMAGAQDGILDWDIVNDSMYVSERAMHLVGLARDAGVYTRAEWSALVMPRFHPDDTQRLGQELRGDPRSPAESHEGEYRVLGDDNQYRWVRFRGRAVRNAEGRAIRWAGSVSDVDGLKRTEEALRRSEERYALAVAGSNEGLWDWDLINDSLFLSPRAQEILWLTPGEPQRPRREWVALTHYHPDDRSRVRDAVSAHLRGSTPHYRVEYRLQHHSGEWRWYRQRGVAVRDAKGRPTRMAGSMEDITDRKNAEGERERLEGQLRQAQKLEAIGTLAGGIAHDFNNILAAILGYGEMAQRDAAEGTAQRRHIDAAISAGMRAKSLVERILAFSRTGMAERVPVHVQSVVAEALDLVQASLPAGVQLDRQLDAGDAAIMGDPTQVHQVVMNLCANAVQAIKDKGALTVTLDLMGVGGSRCATSVLADANHVRLRVCDSGAGIAPQVLERIFDPFFTTKEVGVGTGLGLSLVHGIVTDLGGGIEVESQLGMGSTFTVYLPWQSCVAVPEPVQEEPVPNGNGETILLVDDEEPLVRLGEEMIAELGYEPVGFTSSLQALASFRAEPQRFNAVLSDEAMPEMTGSELVREILKIRPDIPIVLMSGYVTSALAARARDAGVSEVLCKPLVSREIARGLANALQR
jgi:PAS domain S-box-containing protein